MKSKIKSQHHYLKQRSVRFDVDITKLNGFDSFYKLSVARDKKASTILQLDPKLLNTLKLKGFDRDVLQAEGIRHEELNIIKAVVKISSAKDFSLESQAELCKKISSIDTDNQTNKIVINQFAKQQGVDAKEIHKVIKPLQKHYRKKLLKELSTQYPILDGYLKLTKARFDAPTTFEKEKIGKRMPQIARQVALNKELSEKIKTYLPKLKNSLNKSIQRSIEKDIER